MNRRSNILFVLLHFLAISIVGLAQSPGDLVITEFMANPASVLDDDGEYVEFYNNTSSSIDINGFILRDDDTDSHTIDNGGPLLVSGFSFIVLGRNGDPGANGGYSADYQYASFILANGGDEIVLENGSGVEICRLNYSNGDPFGSGVSAELNNVSNHSGGVTQEGDYVAATTQYGNGDFGSPRLPGNTQGTGGGDPPPGISNVMRTPRIPAANENTTISAEITDNSNVVAVELHYTINEGALQMVAMSNTSGNNYSADIPETAYADGDRVAYSIWAQDDSSQISETLIAGYFAGTTPISEVHPVDGNGALIYDGYDARVTGVATVNHETFSTQDLDVYMQDASAGINVFRFGVDTSFSFIAGYNYTVVSTVDQYNGKTEITPDDTTDIIDNGPGTPPSPLVRTIAELLSNAETYEGMLIAILQVDTTASGDSWPMAGSDANIEITDDGGSNVLTLRIDKDTNIDGTPEPNWPVNIAGIFSQFDQSSPYTEDYQILPRSTDDIDIVVGIEPISQGESPQQFSLHQNYPNPFNPVTTLRLDIPAGLSSSSKVELNIYNNLGQKVTTLIDRHLPAGSYEIKWNGTTKNGNDVPSGAYFGVLNLGGLQRTIKMMLLK